MIPPLLSLTRAPVLLREDRGSMSGREEELHPSTEDRFERALFSEENRVR